MSLRARARRHRLRAALRSLKAELARLPAYMAPEHGAYTRYVQAVIREVAGQRGIPIRGPLGPLP